MAATVDRLVLPAIREEAARAARRERRPYFSTDDIERDVIRSKGGFYGFVRSLYGDTRPTKRALAERVLKERISRALGVRDKMFRRKVRVYVCYRIAGRKPRAWVALRHARAWQLAKVIKDRKELAQAIRYGTERYDLLRRRLDAAGKVRVKDILDEQLADELAKVGLAT